MEGIATKIPSPYYEKVYDMWEDLKNDYGFKNVFETPYPHFTFQVVEKYNTQKIISSVEQIAKVTKPFKVRTGGIGIFNSEQSSIFIPVVKSKTLMEFHQLLWNVTSCCYENRSEYYNPENWMPHITLVLKEASESKVSKIIEKIVSTNFAWEFTVDNLIIGNWNNNGEVVMTEFKLDG